MLANLRRSTAVVACTMSIAITGCAALRKDSVTCRVVSGLGGSTLGAVAGGGGAHAIDSSPDGLEIAFSSAIGWLVGGAVGYGLGYWACPVEEAPAAPPPPPPTAAAPAPAKRRIVLRGVHFDFNAASLRPDARAVLDEAASTLREAASVRVAVEGHTDGVGSDAYNLRLSERRAQTVGDELTRQGIDAGRIAIAGLGETKPVASNDTEEGRAQNRRVELRVLD